MRALLEVAGVWYVVGFALRWVFAPRVSANGIETTLFDSPHHYRFLYTMWPLVLAWVAWKGTRKFIGIGAGSVTQTVSDVRFVMHATYNQGRLLPRPRDHFTEAAQAEVDAIAPEEGHLS